MDALIWQRRLTSLVITRLVHWRILHHGLWVCPFDMGSQEGPWLVRHKPRQLFPR